MGGNGFLPSSRPFSTQRKLPQDGLVLNPAEHLLPEFFRQATQAAWDQRFAVDLFFPFGQPVREIRLRFTDQAPPCFDLALVWASGRGVVERLFESGKPLLPEFSLAMVPLLHGQVDLPGQVRKYLQVDRLLPGAVDPFFDPVCLQFQRSTDSLFSRLPWEEGFGVFHGTW